jgi:hypothetical protein
MKNTSVVAIEFQKRCLGPDFGTIVGCVWPFVHEGVNFTDGQCASANAEVGDFGWCATEVTSNNTVIESQCVMNKCN